MTETKMPLIEFNVTDAALTELAERYKEPKVPTTPGEYEGLVVDIKVVRDLRIAVEKSRKEQNADALAHQRNVNKEGHRIIDALKAIEDPMKACKATVDDAKEREVQAAEELERARIEGIQDRVRDIENLGVIPFGVDMQGLINRVSKIDGINPGDGSWDEYAKRAADAKQHSLEQLTRARDEVKRKEAEQKQLDEDREKLEAAQEKQREDQSKLDADREELEEAQRKQAAEDQAAREAELEELKKKELQDQAKRDKLAAAERAKKVAPDKDKLLAVAEQIGQIIFHQCGDPRAQEVMERYHLKVDQLADAIKMEVAQL